ncbi:MAG: endonuclease/exonuclease/phosphatase family protein [Sulfuritalea sp.]|nr:endonuclease/exonuclease/phosphatase family protein [Sulfuritalea sp.]
MKLLSWNVQWCRGVDGRVDPARIACSVKEMTDADVICFQEVARNYPSLAGSGGEDQFALLAAAFPDYKAVEGIAVDVPDVRGPLRGTRSQFGNLLLSRLPIGPAFRHLLPHPADPVHADMPRVAIEATIETPGGPVRVTTTHLAYYSGNQRLQQVEALRELHAQAHALAQQPAQADASRGPFHWIRKPDAAIVVGDFNFTADTTEYTQMLAPFADGTPRLHDAWRALNPGQSHAATVGVYDRVQWPLPFCCDFAFISADLLGYLVDVEINSETDASDHQPLLLTLTFPDSLPSTNFGDC